MERAIHCFNKCRSNQPNKTSGKRNLRRGTGGASPVDAPGLWPEADFDKEGATLLAGVIFEGSTPAKLRGFGPETNRQSKHCFELVPLITISSAVSSLTVAERRLARWLKMVKQEARTMFQVRLMGPD